MLCFGFYLFFYFLVTTTLVVVGSERIRRIRSCSGVFLVMIVTFVLIGLLRINPRQTKQKKVKQIRRKRSVFLVILSLPDCQPAYQHQSGGKGLLVLFFFLVTTTKVVVGSERITKNESEAHPLVGSILLFMLFV